ncbi:MAG: fimbria/pilus periplasmic chaperone [Nevskia sp.]|nr:fimbria/pilus periplasmic chaperone [Nevskia sp.]
MALLGAPAGAASLQVSPVTLVFQAGQPALGITLHNTGDAPLTGQVRVFTWGQDGKDDTLQPADKALVASPPMVVIAPQAEQLVRVVRLNREPADHELTYRLLIDELPPPQSGTTPSEVTGGVNFRLRYSIPVFVPMGGAPAEPKLDWTLRQRDGSWFIAAANHGATHAQLSAVKLTAPDGDSFEVSAGLLGYALAGNGREWRLPEKFPAKFGAAGVKVQATVNTSPWPPAPVGVEGSH